MKIDGKWEGKLLDVSGLVALLKVHLKEEEGKISGDFSVFFFSPAEGSCGKTTKRLVHSGPVSGKMNYATNHIQLNYNITIEGEPIIISFEGSITEADPHALSAIRGYYDLEKGKIPLTLEGGSCLLWLYRVSKKGGNDNG